MQQICLTTQADARTIAALAGQFPDESWYDTLYETGDVMVFKPDGSPLACVLRQAVTGPAYAEAYKAIVPLARSTGYGGGRGMASGIIDKAAPLERFADVSAQTKAIGAVEKSFYRPLKKDGTLSKTRYSLVTPSYIAGHADPSARFPYCRQTAYTHKYPERMRALLPCLRRVSELFATHLPERYAAQQAMIERTSPAFTIPGTVFTTLTVNRNWQTALHQDAGDLKAGFGVMLCFRFGTYEGGYFTLPQFRVAFDLRAGDLLLADVHEWHGNTPIQGNPSRYERITMVCYYREKMIHCGTVEEEVQRAKQRGKVRTV